MYHPVSKKAEEGPGNTGPGGMTNELVTIGNVATMQRCCDLKAKCF